MNEKDEELMKGCIRLAIQGIDLEEIMTISDLEGYKIIKCMRLAMKNYNFIKRKK